MPSFSRVSRDRLATAHPLLRKLFEDVVLRFDCSILCGHRDQEDQEAAFLAGRSKVRWPNSKHNSLPSMAVDVAPYPIDWSDVRRFYYFGGYVVAHAERRGIELRWGGDWDSDFHVKDQNFNDLVHFELR